MQPPIQRILLIDDDYCQNVLALLSIKKVLQCNQVDVVAYTNSAEALGYIENEYRERPVATLLLLDIYMPIFTGWDVLDRIAKMPESIRQCFSISILSGANDHVDEATAASYSIIKNYFQKPLSAHLDTLFAEITEGQLQQSFRALSVQQLVTV